MIPFKFYSIFPNGFRKKQALSVTAVFESDQDESRKLLKFTNVGQYLYNCQLYKKITR